MQLYHVKKTHQLLVSVSERPVTRKHVAGVWKFGSNQQLPGWLYLSISTVPLVLILMLFIFTVRVSNNMWQGYGILDPINTF